MPGYKAPIKERMLYSSCKNPLVDQIEQHLGLELAKKVSKINEGLARKTCCHRIKSKFYVTFFFDFIIQ